MPCDRKYAARDNWNIRRERKRRFSIIFIFVQFYSLDLYDEYKICVKIIEKLKNKLNKYDTNNIS